MTASARLGRQFLVAGLVAMLAILALCARANAGEFTVKQCAGSNHAGFSGQYLNLNTLDRVDVVTGCVPGEPSHIGVYQDRSGRPVQGSGGGQFIWAPDPSIRITGTTFTARLRDVDGMRAYLLGPRSSGGATVLDEGQPHDGQLRTMRWSGEESAPSLVVARLICVRVDGCENNPDTPKAYFEVYDLEIQGRDFLPPSLEASGEIWDRSQLGGWHRGPVAYRLDAFDRGTGVSGAELEVNGLTVRLPEVGCSGDQGSYSTSFAPCPPTLERTGLLATDTSAFRDGPNQFRFCVSDFAIPRELANRTCTGERTLMVDNTRPLPPAGLEAVGGSGWRANNGFHFTWKTPPGQASPIASAAYRVIDLRDGLQVDEGVEHGAGIESFGPLEVPAVGEYRVEVSLKDEAGNAGEVASTVVRFDDSPPGDVEPERPAGWISDDEFPLSQPIDRAAVGGPSGIGGYAIAVSSGAPVRPCAHEVCSPSELAIAGGPDRPSATIPSLAEGNHWVSAVAASGARLSSRQPGATLIRVDRTDPVTSISGVPAGWVNRPVTLTARASDALSGMSADPAADDGTPMTVIAPEGQPAYEAGGDQSTFTIASEGSSRVEFWAMDLAGNVNDGRLGPNGERHRPPDSTLVKIDLTPPEIAFSTEATPTSPETVEVVVSDPLSGVESGQVEIRRVGATGSFMALGTELVGNVLRARIPSDDLPAGVYELRASAVDRAGNPETTVSRQDGSAMITTLPLKRRVSLSLRHQGRKPQVRNVTFTNPRRSRFAGMVRLAGGPGIPGARLTLEQRFRAGSRQRVVRSRIVADGTGRFAFGLRTGPSRSVRVLYSGTDLNSRTASRKLGLVVRDRTTLSLTPGVLRNGGRTTMRGAVIGRGAIQPAGGKLVAIQFFDPDRARWRPVEVLRADPRGRFRYSYRFRTITSAQRILFRAVSLAEAGWPYGPSTSGPRSVIVYPKRSR